jgi:hypothetical protein
LAPFFLIARSEEITMRPFHSRDMLLAGPVVAACVSYVLAYLAWDDFPTGPNPQDYMVAAGNIALLSLLPFGYLWFRDRRDHPQSQRD